MVNWNWQVTRNENVMQLSDNRHEKKKERRINDTIHEADKRSLQGEKWLYLHFNTWLLLT